MDQGIMLERLVENAIDFGCGSFETTPYIQESRS